MLQFLSFPKLSPQLLISFLPHHFSLATVSLMMDEFSGNEGDTVRVCGSLDYDERYDITLSVNVVPSLWDDEIAGM